MNIHPDYESHQLIIHLEGELTSVNAPIVKDEIQNAMTEYPELTPSFDADQLVYISSAGLRLLLTICQNYENRLSIFNVSSNNYEIFEMTGFTTIMNVQKRMREINVDGCEIIGKGAFGTVYRLDIDTVVKVYKNAGMLPMIRNEQKRARQAFLKGIPTAIPFDIVRVGEKYGTVFEMIKARNCGEWLIEKPENIEEILDQYTAFIKSVHSVEMVPGDLPDIRDVYEGYLNKVSQLLPEETVRHLRDLIREIPESKCVVHGDIQMKNVMLSDDQMILIDMDTLALGDPVFEFAGLFMAYVAFNEDDPNDALKFLGINVDTCRAVYLGTLSRYLNYDAQRIQAAKDKISLIGYLRFLYVIADEYNLEEPVRRLQVNRATSQIEALTKTVGSLALREE